MWGEIRKKLEQIYTRQQVEDVMGELHKLKKVMGGKKKQGITERDVALITYANSVADGGGKTLPVLTRFLMENNLQEMLSIVHILPFYPWDTDRGFSIKDFYQVDERYGTWQDVKELAQRCKLMVDFVANHASIDNPYVQGALVARHLSNADQRFADFVLAYDDKDRPSDEDVRTLIRPRSTPVLSRYCVVEKNGKLTAVLGEAEGKVVGKGYVWTTFSRPKNADGSEATCQVDLNFANPKVLVEAVKVMLFYVQMGAKLIRLDAIGYLWKKLKSTSLHEPEVHLILQIIKQVFSEVSPETVLIAEVNEPQDKIVGYLGSREAPEADLVYQFTHFPLAIHGLMTGNGKFYSQWLKTTTAFAGRQFVTVLGSHDGLGLKPVRGILPAEEIDRLTKYLVDELGGLPNYSLLPGGEKIVYEICATPWNLINNPKNSEAFAIQLTRYLTVVALGLAVRGLPAIYINGLVGCQNYQPAEGLDENRTVNREILDYETLVRQMGDTKSKTRRVVDEIKKLAQIRADEPAFDPAGPATQVIDCKNEAVVAQLLVSGDGKEKVLAMVNLAGNEQKISLPEELRGEGMELIGGQKLQVGGEMVLTGYSVQWVKISKL